MTTATKRKWYFTRKELLTAAATVLCRRRGDVELPVAFSSKQEAEAIAAECGDGARAERCRPGFPSRDWYVVKG